MSPTMKVADQNLYPKEIEQLQCRERREREKKEKEKHVRHTEDPITTPLIQSERF